MQKQPNTDRHGGGFSATTIDAVWRKATPLSGYPDYAKDQCGANIHRHSHGTTSEYSWEVDHIKPVALGGTDDLSNLQPLHWKNNRGKSDNYPRWSCTIGN